MIIAFDSQTGQIATIEGLPGMPVPAAVLWTSKPYPVEVVESLDVVSSSTVGWLFTNPVDYLDVSVSLAAGALVRVIAYTTINALQELDVSTSLASGLLRQIGINLDVGHEDLDSSASLVSGVLVRVVGYVSTDQIESLDVSVSLNGGTLA